MQRAATALLQAQREQSEAFLKGHAGCTSEEKPLKRQEAGQETRCEVVV